MIEQLQNCPKCNKKPDIVIWTWCDSYWAHICCLNPACVASRKAFIEGREVLPGETVEALIIRLQPLWKDSCEVEKKNLANTPKIPGDETMECIYCKSPADGKYSIYRDGFNIGPEVPLCSGCGGGLMPSLADIWELKQLRIAHQKRRGKKLDHD